MTNESNPTTLSRRKNTTLTDEPLEALLAHQSAIAAVRVRIENIKTLISNKQEKISNAEKSVPDIEHLAHRREDLLAALAIGQAKEVDVKEFDKKSEAERAAYQVAQGKAKQIVDEETQAITGLRRKLLEAQTEITALHSEDSDVLRNLLESDAESTGAEYVQAALEVKKHYLRLTALDSLLRAKALRPAGIIGHGVPINLPVFQLSACEGKFNPNYPESIFSDFLAHNSGAFQEAVDVLRNELMASGITLLGDAS